ncbi:alaserpin-like isoform X2 [Cydia pomonella]|uniref:alaserpin-like isoform X2 n=1 Tax=Cydia pomonella TaxID=82600 RepID=UPI002ADE2A73|nr:alaserpin-like isoform X2 [Cydia pomonella]
MANKVYFTNKSKLQPDIQKDAEEVFQSALEQLDFTESAAAAGAVNKWVAEQTEDMIKDVVDAKSLNSDTRLLLINAIYFQGFWETPFRTRATRDRPFHVDLNTQIKVPMMSMHDVHFRYKHSPELKAQFLQMDYKGRQASMVIVLPDEIEGLGAVLQQLAAGHDLMAELTDMKSTLLDVMVPKFKIETEIDLTQLLPEMGIKLIFDDRNSNINMLTSNEPLYVSKAVQKALIEVDEAGTKAVARTTFYGYLGCLRVDMPLKWKFEADRPFIYLLKVGQIPVFLGTYQGSEFALTDVYEPDLYEPKPVTACGWRRDKIM